MANILLDYHAHLIWVAEIEKPWNIENDLFWIAEKRPDTPSNKYRLCFPPNNTTHHFLYGLRMVHRMKIKTKTAGIVVFDKFVMVLNQRQRIITMPIVHLCKRLSESSV